VRRSFVVSLSSSSVRHENKKTSLPKRIPRFSSPRWHNRRGQIPRRRDTRREPRHEMSRALHRLPRLRRTLRHPRHLGIYRRRRNLTRPLAERLRLTVVMLLIRPTRLIRLNETINFPVLPRLFRRSQLPQPNRLGRLFLALMPMPMPEKPLPKPQEPPPRPRTDHLRRSELLRTLRTLFPRSSSPKPDNDQEDKRTTQRHQQDLPPCE